MIVLALISLLSDSSKKDVVFIFIVLIILFELV